VQQGTGKMNEHTHAQRKTKPKTHSQAGGTFWIFFPLHFREEALHHTGAYREVLRKQGGLSLRRACLHCFLPTGTNRSALTAEGLGSTV